MTCKSILSFFLFFGPSFIVNSMAQQIPHFVEKLTTAEGLSSNGIIAMVQDDNGFLWIGTNDGLNRFDGTEVTKYYSRDSSNSLVNNYVYCLKKLPGNYLAIGTQSGLSFYNGSTGVFHNFYYARNNTLDEYNNSIIQLETDTKGNLWAVSRNCIYVFDAQRNFKRVFLSPFTEVDATRRRLKYAEKILPLPGGNVLCCLYNGWYTGSAEADSLTPLEASPLKTKLGFAQDMSAKLVAHKGEALYASWHIFKVFEHYFFCIGADTDSLVLVDENGVEQSRCYFPYNKYPYVSWSQRVAMIDSSTLLLLFHNYGFAIIPVSWQKKKPVLHEQSPLLFETTEYEDALCDRQGNWWLATTESGLEKISPAKQSFKGTVLAGADPEKKIASEVVTVSRYGNTLWMATYGDGFFKAGLQSGGQEHFGIDHPGYGVSDDFVWNVRQVSRDSLWVGTQVGLFWYCLSNHKHGRIAHYPGKPSALDSVSITTQFVDSHGLVWMGLGIGKGVCYFDSRNHRFVYFRGGDPQAYPLRYPLTIAEDKKGDLWFTSDASTSLVYWNRNTGRFKTVPLPAAQRKQLSSLYSIYCENDSLLWLGTTTSGLVRFNHLRNTVTLYGHDNGLVNSHVNSIYEDGRKRLWLVTNGGLSCFDRVSETFSNYSEKEGLPVRTPTAFFYYDSLDKRLYSGGHGAYFSFDPERINTTHIPQKTIITAMEVNGKTFVPVAGSPAELGEQQNDITIHYAAVDLASGPETRYAYKLIGEDTGWVMTGHQRQINFSHLAPGHYTFVVRSGNSYGVWNRGEASISFFIRPPFTQTGLFYAQVVLAIGAVFYLLHRFRLRQLVRTEQIRAEISRNLHDEVGSTLTNISLGSLLAQKQLDKNAPVNKLLERIYQDSQTVSQTMREIVWSINPKIDTLGEALPRMLQYASELLEAKGIELHAEIAPGIERVKLTMQRRRDLYLIFKEAVTNLARHSNALEASISFRFSGNTLVMIIADDGVGFINSDDYLGNGLKNMRERADSHQWQLELHSGPGEGTTLILKAETA